MPNVGGVKYPYTPQGMAQARRAAANLGQTVPGYQEGGSAGKDDPREGFDTTGSSVQYNPGFGLDLATLAKTAGMFGMPVPVSAAFGAFNALMGDYGVVPTSLTPPGFAARPQIGGHVAGGTQADLEAAREATEAQKAVAKALNIDATMPSADSPTGQEVDGGGFGFGGAGSGGITGHGGQGGLGRNTPKKDGGLIEAQGGLGFRPLHYQDGTGPEGVEDPSTQHERDLTFLKDIFSGDMENLPPRYRWDLNTLERAFYEWENDPDVARRAAEKLRKALEGPQEEFYPMAGQPLVPGTLFEEIAAGPLSGVRPGDTGPYPGGQQRWGPNYSRYMNKIAPIAPMAPMTPMEERLGRHYGPKERLSRHYGPVERLGRHYGGPPREMRKERLPEYGKHVPQDIAHGGYVGERPGHYANGGYASRGTVAGELPRYGYMSVREEGETMGELSKRHRDQNWHSRMRGGLGSLGPRRRIA